VADTRREEAPRLDDSGKASPEGAGTGGSRRRSGPAAAVAAAAALNAETAVTDERGSAGVGLAPSRRAGALTSLTVDTSLEGSHGGSGDLRSAPEDSTDASHSGSGRAPKPSARAAIGGGGASRVGVSGGDSNNLSEVSEDFPSDFDGPSPTVSQEAVGLGGVSGGRTTPLGDTLELSNSNTMDDLGASAVSAFDTEAAAVATKVRPEATAGQVSEKLRWGRVEAEVKSLMRALAGLKDIREKQRQYLQLLQVGT